MKILFSVISIIILSSCTNEKTVHESFPLQILHGNSAKVWILSESNYPEDSGFTELKDYRKSYIFYSNRRFRQQELIHLGSNKGLIGKFEIKIDKSGDNVLVLTHQNGTIEYFLILEISNELLTLSDYQNNRVILKFESLKSPSI